MKTIELVISPNGKTRVETKGFAGSSCQTTSEFIEKALGRRIGEQLTAEFYASQDEQQNLREGN